MTRSGSTASSGASITTVTGWRRFLSASASSSTSTFLGRDLCPGWTPSAITWFDCAGDCDAGIFTHLLGLLTALHHKHHYAHRLTGDHEAGTRITLQARFHKHRLGRVAAIRVQV